jgi:REP element-mobilizing transposase RayT
LPSLRSPAVFAAIRSALARTARAWFRIVHFSVQADHVHILVEADDKTSLSRGVVGVVVRLARSFNRVVGRRGRLWGDRYHARTLATPREVRHALVYVLMNWKKHVPGAVGLDPCSSASMFEGWKDRSVRGPPSEGDLPVRTAETWLVRAGWRRHGLIGIEERPRTNA